MDLLLPQLCIITGYYGVGKTNLALNMARWLAQKREPVTLVDLDIINPYFRSSDYPQLLENEGVSLLAPTFARSTLENPSLPAAINGAFDAKGIVIVDVGGDDAGATTLSRYREDIRRRINAHGSDFAFWYVISRFRSNTPTINAAAAEAVAQLHAIEAACGLRATGIINNTHLQIETTLDTIREGLAFGRAVAELDALPLVASTIPEQLVAEAHADSELGALLAATQLWPLELLVTTPWQ